VAGGRRFPLDGAFAELRQEVEQTREALAKLRATAGAGGGSGGKGSSGAGGRAGGSGIGPTTSEIRDIIKTRDLLQGIGDLKKGIAAGGSVAKALGFEDAATQAEKASKAIGLVEDGVKAVVAAGKAIGALWKPFVVGVATALAAVEGVNQVLQLTDGRSRTLTQTFKSMGFAFSILFQKGQVELMRLKTAFSGSPLDAKALEETQAALKKTEDEFEALNIEIGKNKQAPADETYFEALKRRIEEFGTDMTGPDGPLTKLSALFDKIFAGPGGQTSERGGKGAKKAGVKAGESFADGVREGLARLADPVAATTALLSDMVTGFAATISDSIMDAFDPEKGGAKERFDAFIKGITRSVMQMIIQIAIAKALLAAVTGGIGGIGTIGASGVAGIGGTLSGALGLAGGGRVPGRGRASLAHLFAPGFAAGGRPAGLPSSDTVAAWLTPGEWVQPLAAVRKYGARVMEGLRTLSIPAEPLMALADGVHVAPPVSVPAFRGEARGYAAGGQVAGGGGAGRMVNIVPALVTDPASMERLAVAGWGEQLRLMRDRRDEARAALGIGE
jgi:hypothetical protein